MKLSHKKETLKVYGEAAEIFEDALIPFLPKILTYLQRKLKEGDEHLHGVISESMGALVLHVFKKVESLDDLIKEFNPILKLLFTNLSLPTRSLQQGSAMCLTRVIQNAPVMGLQSMLSYISHRLFEILQNSSVCRS
mmetsp:Transcript_6966/g.6118  ORF Transcript_6966/g.6118 Transcript_6966/m.6118 type:complete len:137 (+) Transcript_6966:237-647(+)